MSNDLISRNAVMDYLREQQANVIIEKNKNGFVNADVCDGMSSAIVAFMNFIVQMPIAYDVDKAVEQLKSQKNQYFRRAEEIKNKFGESFESQRLFSKACSYDNAIQIAKSGGIE